MQLVQQKKFCGYKYEGLSGPPLYYLLTFSNCSQLISNEYTGCISGCYFGLICFTEAFADLWHVMKERSNSSLSQLTGSHKLSLRSAHELHWQSLLTVTTHPLQQQACFSQARASQPCPRALAQQPASRGGSSCYQASHLLFFKLWQEWVF